MYVLKVNLQKDCHNYRIYFRLDRKGFQLIGEGDKNNLCFTVCLC